MCGTFIADAEPLLGHTSGDAGGQEGLAQARIADEQQIFRLSAEVPDEPAAAFQIPLHDHPGAGPVGPVGLFGIVIQPEIPEILRTDAHARQLPPLFLAAQVL